MYSSLDFSDSSISTTEGPVTHFTRRYSAPEVLDHDPRNRLTDIWGLGCVLFEILSRLYGHKLKEMIKFWQANGNREVSYAQNPEATASWLRKLINSETKTQHGYSRSRMWLLSFIHHNLLKQDRLLRPTAEQILGRLKDLDAAYPVSTSRSWVGPCCTDQSALLVPPIAVRQDVPQWPILDFLTADDHLSYLFLDENLDVIAMSSNLSIPEEAGSRILEYLFPAGPNLEQIQKEARSLKSLVTPRQHSSTESGTVVDRMMLSVFTSRLNNTTFWVNFFDVRLLDHHIPRVRTVQLSLHTIDMERQPDYRAPFIVMTFDPREGEVATGYNPKQGKATDFSYKEGRDVWTDGLSIATTLFPKRKSDMYVAIAAQVSQRRREYEKLVSHRSTMAM